MTAPLPIARLTIEETIAKTEQWIRTVGIHLDRETELVEELFGPRGRLFFVSGRRVVDVDDEQELRADLALRARLTALWRGHRQSGVKLEREDLERAEAWKDAQARAKELRVE